MGCSILLHLQDTSICFVPALGVFDTRCSPCSFTGKPPPSVSYHLGGSGAGCLHVQAAFVHPASSSPGALRTRSPPGASPSLFVCKPPPVISSYLLVSLRSGALHASSHARHLPPSQTISWCPSCQVPSGERLQAPSCASLFPPFCVICWRPWHWVPSQDISILPHMQVALLRPTPSFGVFGFGWPCGVSWCSFISK